VGQFQMGYSRVLGCWQSQQRETEETIRQQTNTKLYFFFHQNQLKNSLKIYFSLKDEIA
jgi:hypothetical protein